MSVQERLYTADDLWELSHLPENAEKRFELVDGVVIEMVPTGGEHGVTSGNSFGHIWNFVNQHRLGWVTAAETGFILFKKPNGKDTVRAPDVGFVSLERAPHGLPSKYVPFPPDMIVEVVSPTDMGEDIEAKVDDYIRAGVRLQWWFYPSTRTVIVYTQSEVHRLTENDTLDGGDVLPGFTLAVSDIFPKA